LQALLAFAEDRCVQSEEVAIFFGPTATPVGVSTEGVLARPFRAELVLATLQKSVVEEAPVAPVPPSALGRTVSGASGALSSSGSAGAALPQKQLVDPEPGDKDAGAPDQSVVDESREPGLRSTAERRAHSPPLHRAATAAAHLVAVGGAVSVSSTRSGFPADAMLRRVPNAHMLTQQSDNAGARNDAASVAPVARHNSVVSVLDDDSALDADSRASNRIDLIAGGGSDGDIAADAIDRTTLFVQEPRARSAGGALVARSFLHSGVGAVALSGYTSPSMSLDPDSRLLDGHHVVPLKRRASADPPPPVPSEPMGWQQSVSSAAVPQHPGERSAPSLHAALVHPAPQQQQRMLMSLTQPQTRAGDSESQEF
jgi:hypothetical protein